MTRRVLLLGMLRPQEKEKKGQACRVHIVSDTDNNILLTVPGLDRGEVMGMIKILLGPELKGVAEDLQRVFGKAEHITLVMTTKCGSN